MPLAASCPRCTSPVSGAGADFTCHLHGPTEPLWRPDHADYDSLVELLGRLGEVPAYLPWPPAPGWTLSDFGCVGQDRVRATVTTTVGASTVDGEIGLTVVTEDPAVGLGARVAGTLHDDPGPQLGHTPPAVHVRVDHRPVPLWLVEGAGERDDGMPPASAVFAGESGGRWLWLVVRPASAALLLQEDWLLADLGGLGPQAVELALGGPRPTW